MSANSAWPSAPLEAAEKAFMMLAQSPTHVPFDARSFDGLPHRILRLDELRKILVAPKTPDAVRHEVWRSLVLRARRDGPAWRIAAVGMAMPGLVRKASRMAEGWYGDPHDLESEMVLEFAERLRTIDLFEPRICGRLMEAAARAARTFRDADSDTMLIRSSTAGPLPPIRPWDHPELVLARAVAEAVLDRDEAQLIAETRLDDCTLTQLARDLGITWQTASDWRARAEARLKKAIERGELTFVPLRQRRRTTNNATNSDRSRGVGQQLGARSGAEAALGTQQKAYISKTSDRKAGVRAPGIAATPA